MPDSPKTLFDKLWDSHVITDYGDGSALLHVDRHLVHDLGGPAAYADLAERGLPVHSPGLTYATPDHVVSSTPGRTGSEHAWAEDLISGLRTGSLHHGVRLFDVNQPGHGIVHVLATQTLVQQRPRRMRVTVHGALRPGVSAKDLSLALISRLGAAAGTGYAIEYAGLAIDTLPMAGRLTLCNMSIEMGARIGLIAPDDSTLAWLKGRRFAPNGSDWDQAVAEWRTLRSDPGAVFDREEQIDADTVKPTITWGTSPEQAVALDGQLPDPSQAPDNAAAAAIEQALAYMGLAAGQPIAGTRIDRVFIGSCTNGRLEDLRAAAQVLAGRRIAAHVNAWVVPGSEDVRRAAETEGLDEVFIAAGFSWRSPGCSLCVGANGEAVAPGQRCVSTSNRNFVGRQGPGARTHLASPAVAAACALAGHITSQLPEWANT